MNIEEAIIQRRAVKHFDPSHKFTEDESKKLIELAMLSPTAFNIQHWRLVNVTDDSLRQEIRKVSWDQAQLTDASMLLVLTADLKAWEKEPGLYDSSYSAILRG
jgi:nitroreductase